MAWAGPGAGAGGGQGPRYSVARVEVQHKLARGICEACSLEDVGTARRSETEAEVFKLLRLGLLAARKHADLLDAYPEEQMAPVLGLILARGTHHRFFRGHAKECLEILLARPGWLRLIQRDQEQLTAARALGLTIEPEVPLSAASTWSDDEEDEEPESPDDACLPLRNSASSDVGAFGAVGPLVEAAPDGPLEDIQELLARGRDTLRRCGWRFPPESETPCSGPVAARGGFEGIRAGLLQLVALSDGDPGDHTAVALRPLGGHWVDILGFLASMYESDVCFDLRPRITGVADMLQELSPDFQAALREARELPWSAVPTESCPLALAGLPCDETDRPGSVPQLPARGPAASDASSSAQSDLDRTVADLRRFMESPAGQDLIYRTHECFLYIQGMAAWCRARSRYGHCSIRTLSSLTSAGAAGTVVVGGIIVAASGGIAAPAVVGAITGGLIAGAVSGGVSLANTFAALGLDMLEARFVKARIEELSTRIEVWDDYLRAALEAADAVHGPHALSVFARAVGDYGMKASGIMSIASAIMKVNAAKYDYMAVAAPQALGGMVKAGTPLAQSLMISLSGVGLICGLVDAVSAGFQMWSGYCDAADSLDAHADRFCAMLRMMREIAYDTEAHRSLIGKLPWLLLLEVVQCRVPPPDYRVFDYAKQWTRRPTPHHESRGSAYFQVAVGMRRSGTGDALAKVKPYRWTTVNRAVLLRLLRTDDAEVAVQAFDKRGVQSLVRGDPRMGKEVRLKLRQPCQSRVLAESRDRSTSYRFRYQVVRNGLSTLGQRLSQSATW